MAGTAAGAGRVDGGEHVPHGRVGWGVVGDGGRERGGGIDTEEGAGGILLNGGKDGHRFDVPVAAEIVTDIDLVTKRATVAFPKGLDDLDTVEE